MWQWGSKIHKLSFRTLDAQIHPETKKLFWFLFAGSVGAKNRIRIMSVLRKRPSNRYQLSTELGLEFKGIQHHIEVLEENNLVKKTRNQSRMTYYVSELFMHNEILFDEIIDRLKTLHDISKDEDIEHITGEASLGSY